MKRPTQYGISFRRRLAPRLAGGVLALLAASVLVAESPREEPASETPAASGLRAYIDPETGELVSVPSLQQVEALSKSLEQTLSRSSEGLEPFELSLGGRGVHLRGRFQSALVVRLEADGGLEFSCVEDSDDLAVLLAPAAPSQPPPEEDRGGEPVTCPPPGEPRWVEK
ncbi:MAG: hypothetical protein GY856_00115 [bacterium]|nr:hypothetical protein [bacterium]